MDPRARKALAALATFALLGFQGCGDGSKKETLKEIAGEQGQPIDCEKEAPRLCAMQDMEELKDFIPKNMKQICGGTKSGSHGGLLLNYCKEDCNGGGAADHTVAKMTVCIAETVVRNQVIEWGHNAKTDGGQYVLDEKHTPCQYFVDRACDFDDGYKKFCPVGEAADGTPAAPEGQQRRHELVTYCLDTCTQKVDLAGCMMDKFKEALAAAKFENAEQTANEGELHFMQKVEASVLSEAWGTHGVLGKHNNDILARHASAHCVGSAGKCSDEELDAALLKLKGVAGAVPDTGALMTGLDSRIHDRAVKAQALSEVLAKHVVGGLEAGDLGNDMAVQAVTEEIVDAGVLNPVKLAKTFRHREALEKGDESASAKPAAEGLLELAGATPGEILEGLVDLGERVGRIEPLGAHESVVKPAHHHHDRHAHPYSHRESAHRESAHRHREYAHDRATWVVGPHGHAHRGRALAPDDVME